ncbi:RNA polymerase sigma factor [Anaerocolumna jejuensis]|uniref:RNA polymerase sigma factor n=1 Tax=Anaerocolumna jejuensis TaxID=259063 RepID=UPI003F7B48B5
MDKNEFSEKVLEAEQTLYRVSKSILLQDEDCEDAVQEAVLKAYSKRNSLREEKYFKTWLTRILINECYRLLRTKKQEVSYEDYFQEEQAESNKYSELYEAILKLDIKHRMPIILFYMEGYSVNEIARLLRVPSGTVKSRLSKGRKQLKILLEDEVEYNEEYI